MHGPAFSIFCVATVACDGRCAFFVITAYIRKGLSLVRVLRYNGYVNDKIGGFVMSVKACIFDLDGTLLDTLEDLANSCNAALCAVGLPERSLDEVRAFVGNGVRKLMTRAVPPASDQATIDAAYAAFLPIYDREKAHHTRPYDGIAETVQALRARGIQCAVLSNKDDAAVRALCAQYFPGLFAWTQGMRDGIRPKPAPDALEAICQAMGIAISEAVYIGDSEVDVQTAAACGMSLVAVTWGFRTAEALRQAGATTLIDRPQELLTVL